MYCLPFTHSPSFTCSPCTQVPLDGPIKFKYCLCGSTDSHANCKSYSFENHCAHSFSHSSILRECEYCVNACQRGECVEMQFRAWKLDEYVDTAVSNGKLNNRIDEGGGCLIEREGELRTGSAQYWISLANVGGPGSKWIHEYSCACPNFKCLKSLLTMRKWIIVWILFIIGGQNHS